MNELPAGWRGLRGAETVAPPTGRAVPDYTRHVGLRARYTLLRVRQLPVPGARIFCRLLSRLLPFPVPKGPSLIRTLHGQRMLVDPRPAGGLGRALFTDGTYEEGTLQVLRRSLPAGGTLVDVGANIGVVTLYASRLVGPDGLVVAFEPVRGTHATLTTNITLNRYANIVAEAIAIGSAAGRAVIRDASATDSGASTLVPGAVSGIEETVEVRALDDYIQEHLSNRRIDCLKVDVEGWELEVLRGAVGLLGGQAPPMCIVECSRLHPPHGSDCAALFQFVVDVNRYKVFRLSRGKEIPSRLVEVPSASHLPLHDNLICLTPEHLDQLRRGSSAPLPLQ